MKLLYLTFQEDAPLYLGVKRKIRGQAAAFQKLGFSVTFSMWKERTLSFFGADPQERTIGPGGLMKQFFQSASEYVMAHPCDVLYLRLDRISSAAVRLCKTARKGGTRRIIIEIPNFPYLADYMRNLRYAKGLKNRAFTALKIAVVAMDDRLAGLRLHRVADGAVLYGNHAERFFGLPALNADNGIDTEEIPFSSSTPQAGTLTLLGVAGTLWWQAYDRVLYGMKAYRDAPGTSKRRIQFLLVGGDQTELPGFLDLVRELGLQQDVICPGFLEGEPLHEMYQRADVGISTLGCFRRGITRCSSLKAREYAAAGLPFVYAYDDDSLTGMEPFAMRVSNDETPLDMEAVIAFADRCRDEAEVSIRERRFAEENYDWRAIMERILTYFHADRGDLE